MVCTHGPPDAITANQHACRRPGGHLCLLPPGPPIHAAAGLLRTTGARLGDMSGAGGAAASDEALTKLGGPGRMHMCIIEHELGQDDVHVNLWRMSVRLKWVCFRCVQGVLNV